MPTESNNKISSRLKRELFTGKPRRVVLRVNDKDFLTLRQISYDLQSSIPALMRKALDDFLTANYYPEGYRIQAFL